MSAKKKGAVKRKATNLKVSTFGVVPLKDRLHAAVVAVGRLIDAAEAAREEYGDLFQDHHYLETNSAFDPWLNVFDDVARAYAREVAKGG